MKVLILGICHEIFFFGKKGQKLGCVLYTGAHYTRVNTVVEIETYFFYLGATTFPYHTTSQIRFGFTSTEYNL